MQCCDRPGADLVVWHRREKKQVADLLVNHTIGTWDSWRRDLPPPLSGFRPRNPNNYALVGLLHMRYMASTNEDMVGSLTLFCVIAKNMGLYS